MSDDHAYVFLGGLHKSGTSILHRCIRDHPDVSGFSDTGVHQDEGQLLQTVYPPASAHGGWGRFGFDNKAHLTESSALATDSARDDLLAAWTPHWDMSRHFLVEKSPPNLIRMRFLEAMFPDSRFIVIMRHPIAVTLASLKWATDHPIRRVVKRRTLSRLIQHWVVCHRIMRKDARHIANLKVLTYEDFVVQPDRALREIYEFMGAAPHQRRLEVLASINEEKYLAQWSELRRRGPLVPYIRYIEARWESGVAEFGYSLADPSSRPSWSLT